MGLLFYRVPPPVDIFELGVNITENFEFSENWPGTGNGEYIAGFTGFSTSSNNIGESFETVESWPGT